MTVAVNEQHVRYGFLAKFNSSFLWSYFSCSNSLDDLEIALVAKISEKTGFRCPIENKAG